MKSDCIHKQHDINVLIVIERVKEKENTIYSYKVTCVTVCIEESPFQNQLWQYESTKWNSGHLHCT